MLSYRGQNHNVLFSKVHLSVGLIAEAEGWEAFSPWIALIVVCSIQQDMSHPG